MWFPDVAPVGDGFVVTWSTGAGSATDSNIMVSSRLFASDGTPTTGEAQLNIQTDEWQLMGAVCEKRPAGGYHAVWWNDPTALSSPDDDREISHRSASEAGLLEPGEQVLAGNLQVAQPDVAYSVSGRYIISWREGTGIKAQLFSQEGGGAVLALAASDGRPHVAGALQDFILTYVSGGSLKWQYVENGVFEQGSGNLSGLAAAVGEHAVATFPWGGFIAVWDEGNMELAVDGAYDTDRGIAAIIGSFDHWVFNDGFETGNTDSWGSATQ